MSLLSGRSILHVEDNVDFGVIVRTRLKSVERNLICHNTINGSHALQLLKKYHFDCILCDYSLPDMTGLNLMLHSREYHVNSPFIFLSSQENPSLTRKALQFGAVAFFGKMDISRNIQLLTNAMMRAMTGQKEDSKRYTRIAEEEITPEIDTGFFTAR